ncbi:hypothetical protein OU798_19335 [Prolixibacteraceae bacterium Z1-6]|uniref:Uncharacterized protein n=1 Tax=Draconibacterium aestuarii TaxID=2998507 RepID=A0A9X3F9U4_9BACT|nr:hypothetical protein [Prolixibacteraceae bacterium Z1-6]
MQYKTKTNNWQIFVVFALISILSGCGEMLDDPTIDKNTGEDVNFLIVDFNFFNTRMSYKLVDLSDSSVITLPAKIWFTGTNANDIVNFSGEKKENFTTSQGQMELTFDPNVPVSSNSPLEFTVHVEVNGYETFSQGIQINSEGKKTYELLMTKENSGNDEVLTGEEDGDGFVFSMMAEITKSASTDEQPYEISYRITKADLLKFKNSYGQLIFTDEAEMMGAYQQDPEHFLILTINKSNNYPLTIDRLSIDGSSQMVSFRKLEVGTLKGLDLGGEMVTDLNGGIISQTGTYTGFVEPDIFGFAEFKTDNWEIQGTTLNHTSLQFSYTLASASLEALCATGSSIKFSSNVKSSFSIDADFYDSNDRLIFTSNFKGSFPETFTLENVPAESARVAFRDNNPSFKPVPDLTIDNLCSGSYEVDVTLEEGYNEYQIVFKALCADNSTVAIAPTYSGEIKIKNSNDPWQGIDMIGGIADVMAKPNQDYEIRLLWNEEWESTTFSTNFDANGNYTGQFSSEVTTDQTEDGRTRIKIAHEFEQSICDELGW